MASTQTHVSLDGQWTAKDCNDTSSLLAQVPGCIHLDLVRAGRLPDLNWRDNEDQYHWVTERDWEFSRSAELSPELLAHDRIDVECDGLDTLATVRLNEHTVLSADNMHRRWRAPAKEALKAGMNQVSITCHSPLPMMAAGEARRHIPSWNTFRPEFRGKPYIRKMACSFGWDWGPIAPTAGIFRPIRLVGWSIARIDDLRIRQHHAEGKVDLTVATTLEFAREEAVLIRAILLLNGKELGVVTGAPEDVLTLEIRRPQLWWPLGLGEQPLYTVRVEVVSMGTVIDRQERRIGLRTIEVVQNDDQWGRSFQFRCNGLDFFAKGANWIPSDIFLPRVTRQDYERLLGAARDTNMNMLRLWGGGTFEHDDFYDLCDEMGIVIWHDFMFACAGYPAHEAPFLKSVEGETIDALRRLRHHPAIALWCGNNELEQGLVGDGWTDRHMDWADYKVLFDEMLPNLVKEYDGERFYWPCSPHSPTGDRKKFNNPECGDAHCWDVWFGWASFEAQRFWNHRFQSEFGFQSFPEMRTVRAFAAEEDLNLSSYIMDFHQRSLGRGNKCILAYIGEYLPFPKDLDTTLWLSQVSQAECIRFAVEHSRRSQPRCMGTLYWQINDIWAAPTWASIDSFGRWKALQYSSRRFFAPVQVSGLEDARKKTVEIHVSNQRAAAGSFTTAWTVTDCTGRVLLENRSTNTLAAQRSALITTLDLATLNASSRDLLVWMRVEEADTVLSENLTSLTRWKHLNLKDPAMTWELERADVDTCTLTLKTQAPALFVRLSHDSIDVDWSDNAFHLPAGQTKTITIRPWAKTSLPQLRKGLLVSSLWNTMI